MQISAIGYPTFIYNTNRVSSRSLGKISAIPKDALATKIGYAGSSETTNPLRRGESRDFVGILASQMAMSRQNAARIMKQPETEQSLDGTAGNEMDTIQAMSDMADMLV